MPTTGTNRESRWRTTHRYSLPRQEPNGCFCPIVECKPFAGEVIIQARLQVAARDVKGVSLHQKVARTPLRGGKAQPVGYGQGSRVIPVGIKMGQYRQGQVCRGRDLPDSIPGVGLDVMAQQQRRVGHRYCPLPCQSCAWVQLTCPIIVGATGQKPTLRVF